MWFEVNVRLSEVTDLKWPHGTEWQCGNSTLAISWPYHVQILSFASMASRQGAVKHRFVSKIAGGCSSYDVIAPWPDLTWSFFYQKLCKVCPIRYPKTRRRVRRRFFSICEKPQGGGGCTDCPSLSDRRWRNTVSGRGLMTPGIASLALFISLQLALIGTYINASGCNHKRASVW